MLQVSFFSQLFHRDCYPLHNFNLIDSTTPLQLSASQRSFLITATSHTHLLKTASPRTRHLLRQPGRRQVDILLEISSAVGVRAREPGHSQISTPSPPKRKEAKKLTVCAASKMHQSSQRASRRWEVGCSWYDLHTPTPLPLYNFVQEKG